MPPRTIISLQAQSKHCTTMIPQAARRIELLRHSSCSATILRPFTSSTQSSSEKLLRAPVQLQLNRTFNARSCVAHASPCNNKYRQGVSVTPSSDFPCFSSPLHAPSSLVASSLPSSRWFHVGRNLQDTSVINGKALQGDDLRLGTDFESTPTNHSIRTIRIKRKRAPIQQQINEENITKNLRECLNGYKYRMLKTPQLTNDLITLPVSQDVPPTTPASASPQMIERENYDIRQLQEQHTNDAIRDQPKQNLSAGIKGLWSSLYDNFGNTYQTTSTSSRPSPHTLQSSIRSRRSALLLEEIIKKNSYTSFLPDERHSPEEEEQFSDRITVRSVQAANSIDVVAVLSKVFSGGATRASQYTQTKGDKQSNTRQSKKNQHPLSDFFAKSPPLRHVFGRTNIIIQLSPPLPNCPPSLSHSVPRYVAIYRFGSVVFFNLTTKESSRLLEQIKKHSIDPIAVGFERREHFEVALQPQLETATGKITADRAMVRELDMNTVGIVSNIMGQTVALDRHNDTVDELLANFSTVNSSVERTGGFTSHERHTLFQVVARNNSLFIEMVSKLGIKDRSDTAWHLSQYEALHEGMRKEFDLDERFRDIEFKLNLIQDNAKFFLEVLQSQKSNTLEWVIIVLISFECVLMIMEMSGWGKELLSGWSIF